MEGAARRSGGGPPEVSIDSGLAQAAALAHPGGNVEGARALERPLLTGRVAEAVGGIRGRCRLGRSLGLALLLPGMHKRRPLLGRQALQRSSRAKEDAKNRGNRISSLEWHRRRRTSAKKSRRSWTAAWASWPNSRTGFALSNRTKDT